MRAFTKILRQGLLVAAAFMVALGGSGLPALAADSFQVSGTITNQGGTGLQNVAVTATNPGTATVVAGPATSNASGQYQLSVDAGTYDLHFLPPNGSGLSELIQTNVAVTTNRTVSVQLAPASEQHTFSGVLTDYHGNPVPNMQIWLDRGNNVASTNGQGMFSGAALAGNYNVSIRKDSLDAPEYPYFWLDFGTVNLTNADVVQNYQLPPVHTLTVTTKQHDGGIAPNQHVRLEVDPINTVETKTVVANDQGVAEVPIIEGVEIPAGAVCTTFNPGNAKVCNTSTIVPDQNRSLTLTAPDLNLRTITGSVTDENGVGVKGLDVKFLNGPSDASVKTDTAGNYTATVVGGVYDVHVTKDDSTIAKAFPYFTIASGQVDNTTGNVTKNIQLPAVKNLNVTLIQPNGTPISARVSYNVGDRFQPGNETWSANTDSAGQVTLPAMAGITLPAGSICGYAFGEYYCNDADVPITDHVALTLIGPATHTFSGKLFDANNNPLRNIQVHIGGVSTTTDKFGAFRVAVKAGEHELKFRNDTTQAGLPYFTLPFGTVNLTDNDVQANYNLPQLFNLAVTTKDVNGNLVNQNVYIDSLANFNNKWTANGVANFPVFNGTTIEAGELCTRFEVEPATVCNSTPIAITGDAAFLFQQSAAPVKPGSPANVWSTHIDGNLVITWDYATNAQSYIVYRDGEPIGTTQLQEFADTTVEPGEHTYYVVAVSATGTAGDPSPSITVVEGAVNDTTPPTVSDFTLQPKPANQTMQFSVGATDEGSGVVGGEFFYGADPGQGNGTSMTYADGNLHGTLTSAMPAGVYQVSVRAQDAAGNWSGLKTASLFVTAGVTRAQGHFSFRPGSGDVLPNMNSATIFNQAQANFTVRQTSGGIASNSTFGLTYTTGNIFCTFLPGLNGCHTFTMSLANASTFQLYGTNYSKARVVGTANVTIDGVTTVRPFVAEVVDGNRVNGSTQDSYEVRIYAVGANPYSAAAEYHVAKTVSRSSVMIQ